MWTICSAKLTFFHSGNFEAKLRDPKNVSDVLEIAHTTQASGSTSPTASLVPYYNRREVIKTFIIVTDGRGEHECDVFVGQIVEFL